MMGRAKLIKIQEILAVLKKQDVSAKSVAVDISLLPQDFETVFPQLKGYEAGIFYRPLMIHNIPVTLRVKRRIQIDLAQFDATSYPEIHASVGWLIDEENDGSFGLDLVYNLFSGNQEVHEGILQMVKSSLPDLYQRLKVAIGTGLQEDSGR